MITGVATAAILLVGGVATNADAARAAGNTYGWSWQQPVVYVYDGTSAGSDWKVSEAVAEWNKPADNLTVVMTTDQSIADINVFEGEAQGYLGVATWSDVQGSAVNYCTVELSYAWAQGGGLVAEHTAIHEIGHCLGINHNSTFVKNSVMNSSTSSATAVNRPSGFDYKTLASIY